MDILEKLTKHFGYDPLSKIDPNTQDIKHIEGQADLHRFSQAAIPVILTGLHKFTSTDEGAEEILYPNNSTNWVSKIFASETPEIIKRVNDYSGFDQAGTENKLNDIAAKAVMFIREAVAPASKPIDVKALLEAQINHILSYLPPSLHMGDILKDNALDDRTHKMEGPISSLVQAIGSGFSKADEDKKKN